MSAELAIYIEDRADFDSLHEWMRDLAGVRVSTVAQETLSGEQGSGWDFLIVSCGTGGAVTVALTALRVWLESRVATIRVKTGNSEVELRSSNLDEAMPHLLETVKALRSDGF